MAEDLAGCGGGGVRSAGGVLTLDRLQRHPRTGIPPEPAQRRHLRAPRREGTGGAGAADLRRHLSPVRKRHSDPVGGLGWAGRAHCGCALAAPQAPRQAPARRPDVGGGSGDGAGRGPRRAGSGARRPVQRGAVRTPLPAPAGHTARIRRHPGPAGGQITVAAARDRPVRRLPGHGVVHDSRPHRQLRVHHHHARSHTDGPESDCRRVGGTSRHRAVRRLLGRPADPLPQRRQHHRGRLQRPDRIPQRPGSCGVLPGPAVAVRGRRSHHRHLRGADAKPEGDRHRDWRGGIRAVRGLLRPAAPR